MSVCWRSISYQACGILLLILTSVPPRQEKHPFLRLSALGWPANLLNLWLFFPVMHIAPDCLIFMSNTHNGTKTKSTGWDLNKWHVERCSCERHVERLLGDVGRKCCNMGRQTRHSHYKTVEGWRWEWWIPGHARKIWHSHRPSGHEMTPTTAEVFNFGRLTPDYWCCWPLFLWSTLSTDLSFVWTCSGTCCLFKEGLSHGPSVAPGFMDVFGVNI